jgi:hypothetical protein
MLPGMEELDRLLLGLSVYQDVVVAGQTVRRGVRDCEGRWAAIASYLPAAGVLLDVGANFAWFSRRWCSEGPERLAVAMEADLRSAAVARYSLASCDERRVALCTALADAAAVRRFAEARQRFDAALCLSVLHWIPDHREFLTALGAITDRIFVEQPDPREAGSGVTAIREAIGEIGPYLRSLFSDRPVERIATWMAHRSDELPRELWLIGPRALRNVVAETPTVDAGVLLELDVAWPPRSWWQSELRRVAASPTDGVAMTPSGLQLSEAKKPRREVDWSRLAAGVPEEDVATWQRRMRRAWRAVAKRLRPRSRDPFCPSPPPLSPEYRGEG